MMISGSTFSDGLIPPPSSKPKTESGSGRRLAPAIVRPAGPSTSRLVAQSSRFYVLKNRKKDIENKPTNSLPD